jgi:hypothetical protein
MHTLLPFEKIAQNSGYFCNLQKMPKVNNRPLGENSPNLVTLMEKEREEKVNYRKASRLVKKANDGERDSTKGVRLIKGDIKSGGKLINKL